MAKNKQLLPVLSIIAGVVVLAVPRILGWVIGLYLIIWGVLELKG